MSKFIVGSQSNGVFQALHAAGVFADDPNEVRRVVIDLTAGEAARVYVDKFLDDKFTDVLLFDGIEIVTRESV